MVQALPEGSLLNSGEIAPYDALETPVARDLVENGPGSTPPTHSTPPTFGQSEGGAWLQRTLLLCSVCAQG